MVWSTAHPSLSLYVQPAVQNTTACKPWCGRGIYPMERASINQRRTRHFPLINRRPKISISWARCCQPSSRPIVYRGRRRFSSSRQFAIPWTREETDSGRWRLEYRGISRTVRPKWDPNHPRASQHRVQHWRQFYGEQDWGFHGGYSWTRS